jgi:hypothetical protein
MKVLRLHDVQFTLPAARALFVTSNKQQQLRLQAYMSLTPATVTSQCTLISQLSRSR